MYNKNNLDVAKIASKNSIKPELGSVAFYGNRTVATDSFRVIEIEANGEAHEPKILPAKQIKTFVKLGKNDTIELERIEQIIAQPASPHHSYPDVDAVFKMHMVEDYIEVNLNGRYLAEVLLALSKLDSFEGVTMRVPREANKAIMVEAYGKKQNLKQKGRALVMPFNR